MSHTKQVHFRATHTEFQFLSVYAHQNDITISLVLRSLIRQLMSDTNTRPNSLLFPLSGVKRRGSAQSSNSAAPSFRSLGV